MDTSNIRIITKDCVCKGTHVDVLQMLDRCPPPCLGCIGHLSTKTEFLFQLEFLNLILIPQTELIIISELANQILKISCLFSAVPGKERHIFAIAIVHSKYVLREGGQPSLPPLGDNETTVEIKSLHT